MNTFSNFQNEFPLIKTAYGRDWSLVKDRKILIEKMQRVPLHRRITLRGNKEQYAAKFLQNYPCYAAQSKRVSRNFIVSANTI